MSPTIFADLVVHQRIAQRNTAAEQTRHRCGVDVVVRGRAVVMEVPNEGLTLWLVHKLVRPDLVG